jgi:peptide/nickel transport system substrate-binding protein
MRKVRPRQFDVIVLQVRLGADPDPFPFWHSTQAKDPGLNISGWNSREADAIIATARATTDQSARGELYARLNTTISFTTLATTTMLTRKFPRRLSF